MAVGVAVGVGTNCLMNIALDIEGMCNRKGGSPTQQAVNPPGGGSDRYSCDGSACVSNPDGPYASSDCDNACGGGPGPDPAPNQDLVPAPSLVQD